MRKSDLLNIGDIYGGQLNQVKKNLNESTGPGGKSLDDKNAASLRDGGPVEKSGYKKALNDEDEEYDEDNEDQADKKKKKPIKESKKVPTQKINTNMKNKFDRLYSKVIKENWGFAEDAEDDISALGLDDATPDSDLDADFGGGEGDDFGGGEEVTITLDKATAQTLIDLLQGAIGGGEGEDDFGGEGEIEGEGDLDFGSEGGLDEDNEEEDDDFDNEEDEETYGTKTNAPDKKKVFQAKNNKVGGKVKPSSKKASSDVTDDVGDDGDYGHAISSPKKPNDGKNNKVGNLKKGADFFRN